MILFLGSGVSTDSGLPSVIGITKQLLYGSYYRDTNERGKFYSSEGADLPNAAPLDDAQKLLRLIRDVDEHYLRSIAPYYSGSEYLCTGSIYREEGSYEDLFHLSEQIRQCGMGLTEDAMTGAFVDLVEREAGDLLLGDTREQRLISLYHLSCTTSSFIEWMVASSLRTERIKGLDLVLELAQSKNIDRLDIVTLNHDTLVEQLLAQNDIPFVDGFAEPDGDVRWYDDTVYDAKDASVRIFKPHGSVNWYQFLGITYPAIVVGTDPQQCHKENGDKLVYKTKHPNFLSGVNKVLAYNRGIFSEMFYRFHQVLREHQFMVMSGYGWGDTAINFRLINWFDYNRANVCMLLHVTPEKLLDRSHQLAEYYRALVQQKRLIPEKRWLSDTAYADVQKAELQSALA